MQDWLVVIDMQPGFGDPSSPWAAPGFNHCATQINRMLPLFADRVIFTRFVPPPNPTGAWVQYYQDWSFAHAPENAPLWDLPKAWAHHPNVIGHRFAKWTELRPHLPEAARLVMCGVATDCCVLGTAIEAADDGRFIRVVTDACAAGSDALHTAAVDVMRDRAPMITLSDVETELANTGAGGSEIN